MFLSQYNMYLNEDKSHSFNRRSSKSFLMKLKRSFFFFFKRYLEIKIKKRGAPLQKYQLMAVSPVFASICQAPVSCRPSGM